MYIEKFGDDDEKPKENEIADVVTRQLKVRSCCSRLHLGIDVWGQ